jgi:hypothetical protein
MNNQKEVEIQRKITEFKAMIDQVRSEGMTEWAKFYETKLQTMIAMAKFDGKMK